MNFDSIVEFEKQVGVFFGAPYGIAVDCCTHGIELCLGETNIVDAAVLWKRNSYIPGTFMCVSFQYRKHLSLGRGGIILTDDENSAIMLKKMSYDGRIPDVPWREQNIDTFGFHYYMTPETAVLGLKKLPAAISTKPKKWTVEDWPDLTQMEIFKND